MSKKTAAKPAAKKPTKARKPTKTKKTARKAKAATPAGQVVVVAWMKPGEKAQLKRAAKKAKKSMSALIRGSIAKIAA